MNLGAGELLTRAGADPTVAAAIGRQITDGADYQLVRIDPIQFAAEHGLDPDRALDAFVLGAKVGVFEMVWDMLCPGCGTVLHESLSLKSISHTKYPCRVCQIDNQPTLDDLIEVSFTVTPSTRRVAAHDPATQPFWDYYRDFAFSRMLDLPPATEMPALVARINLGTAEIDPDQRGTIELDAVHALVFEPATHGIVNIEIAGEPATEVQDVALMYTNAGAAVGDAIVRPGRVRLTIDNKSNVRIRVGVIVANDETRGIFGRRNDYLTAKRLFTNQVFRDQFRVDVMDVDQRLKVTSLSVMFTDLKGSTELYDRVGDLAAFDLVRQHFRVLADVIRARSGAIVKTIGDAVMATFPTPDRAIAAALDIRRAMGAFNASNQRDDLVVKIGVHEGPCLAVTLNDRVDYFGQTINVASRVQGLAVDSAIFTTEPVLGSAAVRALLAADHLEPVAQKAMLRGVKGEVTVYEIP